MSNGAVKEGFSESYLVEGAKILLPKLTVVGFPSDMRDDEIISAICKKNEQLNQLVESGKTLEVAKCWDNKNSAGITQYNKIAIKCSPEIRTYIAIRNGGYVFVGLCRCKVYDRYFVPPCFHCYEYNNFSNKSPNKSKPAKYGKCAGSTRLTTVDQLS